MTEKGMWVIGYGSLLFKPPPIYSMRVNGYLKGFVRRFWQNSTDHRGTPDFPGRVATLIPLDDLKSYEKFHDDLYKYDLKPSDRVQDLREDQLIVWGCAYYIAPKDVKEMKEYLDVREKNGYTVYKVPFHVVNVPDMEREEDKIILNNCKKNQDTGDLYLESEIYIGTIDNSSFVGPEDAKRTAEVIKKSEGPSGKNIEYLFKLCEAIEHLDDSGLSKDHYLEDLYNLVKN